MSSSPDDQLVSIAVKLELRLQFVKVLTMAVAISLPLSVRIEQGHPSPGLLTFSLLWVFTWMVVGYLMTSRWSELLVDAQKALYASPTLSALDYVCKRTPTSLTPRYRRQNWPALGALKVIVEENAESFGLREREIIVRWLLRLKACPSISALEAEIARSVAERIIARSGDFGTADPQDELPVLVANVLAKPLI